MKLDKLRTLRRELELEFSPESTTSALYYFFEDTWTKLDDAAPVSANVNLYLGRSQTEPIAYHPTSSRTAWFSCPQFSCSVELTFPTSPQLQTRKRSANRIQNVVLRASNSYQVAHNPLTLLLSRDEFRRRFHFALASETQPPTVGTAEESGQTRQIAVLALDIDHFKQVNDTYGHLYGDQVLKTFAVRLEQVADSIINETKGAVSTCVGHPSGEEFLVLLHGSISSAEIEEYANLFRTRISEDPLPSDKEWAWLSERENLSVVNPPALRERSITTSVGVAVNGSISSDPSQDQVSMLLDQADTALYRAKAAGRNQVISFDSILGNCGRVLEQDAHTRVVALDIGKNVGVTMGQEFKVFPPSFTGTKKFSVTDGRTTRTIGIYPRVEQTRVTVFNVQAEISFAFISNATETGQTIEIGSQLEAIPTGSIGHLLPHAAKYFASASEVAQVGDITSLQEFVKIKWREAAKRMH
jgi:diguanylate cyclase (GGDEF)-like protein